MILNLQRTQIEAEDARGTFRERANGCGCETGFETESGIASVTARALVLARQIRDVAAVCRVGTHLACRDRDHCCEQTGVFGSAAPHSHRTHALSGSLGSDLALRDHILAPRRWGVDLGLHSPRTRAHTFAWAWETAAFALVALAIASWVGAWVTVDVWALAACAASAAYAWVAACAVAVAVAVEEVRSSTSVGHEDAMP